LDQILRIDCWPI